MQANLVTLYFIVALLVLSVLLLAFWLDRSVPKTDKKSWAVVILGAFFWFVVLPLSFVEVIHKLLKTKHHTSDRPNHRNLG
ncbi:MAG: hypothetical protein KME15_21830 [Drouetiella hepatica Uher 2000/2452]|jgi:glycosylphosphatidylinositol transamidase (GPIT) subunit GPI8|uniref:Uncharacterized protein n=1 Tax=Drouetiella hepatica Uher 2000/2452 TaxID=904376 RepID=A0A951QHI8_9CYAN|nr:hypothetical protein [Drouetiella hepatica Uher 2000/2452]